MPALLLRQKFAPNFPHFLLIYNLFEAEIVYFILYIQLLHKQKFKPLT